MILRRTKKQLNTGENWQLLKLESNVKGGIRSLHKSMAEHLRSIQMRILQVIIAETQPMKVSCGATQLIQVHDGENVPAKVNIVQYISYNNYSNITDSYGNIDNLGSLDILDSLEMLDRVIQSIIAKVTEPRRNPSFEREN